MHFNCIQKLEDFVEYFCLTIKNERDLFERNKTIVNIAAIVREKKQEIEQKQLEILEMIMKKLSD
jgi:hypothetical protein